MNKRYQVFVSSTYTDLIEERSEVMQALLELDCMPAGMELFPAANEQQWNWIKKVIDESDYYVVIVGGRYGTLSEATGMSYTEMEYRYAIDTGKPAIAFLHEDPTKIELGRSEQTDQSKKKLLQFRDHLQQRLCKYWNSPADLGAKVSRSITQLIKHHPTEGWVRPSEISEESLKEVLELRRRVTELQDKLHKAGLERPVGVESLAHGNDTFEITFSFETKKPKVGKNGMTYWTKGEELDDAVSTSWDKLFSYLGPELITPITEYQVVGRLNRFLESRSKRALSKKYPDDRIENIRIYSDSFDKIKIQLRALKLVAISDGDKWRLTPYGDNYMTKLLAMHRPQQVTAADVSAAPSRRQKRC